MFNHTTTLGELFKLAKDHNAGMLKLIFRDANQKILLCVAVSAHPEAAQEMDNVLEELQESWDELDIKNEEEKQNHDR